MLRLDEALRRGGHVCCLGWDVIEEVTCAGGDALGRQRNAEDVFYGVGDEARGLIAWEGWRINSTGDRRS